MISCGGSRIIGRRGFLQTAAGASLLGFSPKAEALIPRPKLSICLLAEQFRTDYLSRNFDFFPFGGFRKLLEDGAFFPDCRLLSLTFTATGLASLLTGTYASLHGIPADRWYDRHSGKVVSAGSVRSPATSLIGPSARTGNRIFAIVQSAGAADLMTSAGATNIFSGNGAAPFRFSGTEPISWLGRFNQEHSPESDRDRAWVATSAASGTPPMRTLRYDHSHPDDFLALLASSPFSQSMEMALLRELIVNQKLGLQAGDDTVVVLLESLGRLGAEVGGSSPLVDDEVSNLDREVSALLDLLATRLPPEQYQVVFTATHGAADMPNADSRVSSAEIAGVVEKALAAEYGKGKTGIKFVEAYVYPFLYLRTGRIPNSELPRAREIAGRAAMEAGKVASYLTADGMCSHSGDWEIRLRNSFYKGRSGDVLLVYQPGFVESHDNGRGISYGSPYNYDAQVPLIFYGPAFRAGEYSETIETIDIAPTLAQVSSLPLPSSATGRVLARALVTERDSA